MQLKKLERCMQLAVALLIKPYFERRRSHFDAYFATQQFLLSRKPAIFGSQQTF